MKVRTVAIAGLTAGALAVTLHTTGWRIVT